MKIVVISKREKEEHDKEIDFVVTRFKEAGWRIQSAVTTTTVLVPKTAFLWEQLQYTTTIVFSG